MTFYSALIFCPVLRQKVLKEFADSPLSDDEMLIQLIDATDQLSLMTVEEIIPTYLEISVAGVLFKV